MPEPIATLLATSSLPAGGRVISDALRISILPLRTVLRLQLGARSQKTVAALRIAGRSLPVAMNTWMGDDPVFMRIAPDTWLVESALHDAADLVQAVRTGCGRRSFAVTDVSDAFVTIAVEGALATAVLARGCGLDLSPRRIRQRRLRAHAARAAARRAAAREFRAIRVPRRPVGGAVAVRVDGRCGGRTLKRKWSS